MPYSVPLVTRQGLVVCIARQSILLLDGSQGVLSVLAGIVPFSTMAQTNWE